MTCRVALIPGDGIGVEVIAEGVRGLNALAGDFGFRLEFQHFPYSCQHCNEHGATTPPDGTA